MAIFGRVIGVILGYMVLKTFGAVLGFIIGSFFDKGLRLHLYHFPRRHTAEVQQAFFTATFSVMGHLAKADGKVSMSEIKAAEKIMSRLELNEEMRKEAIRLFNTGKNSDFDLNAALELLYKEGRHDRDLLRFFIEIQLEAALADGELQPKEQEILLSICQSLHFSSSEFQHIWSRQWASQAFHQWYTHFDASSQYDSASQHHSSSQSQYGSRARSQQGYGYQGDYQEGHGYGGARHRASENSLHGAYGVLGIPANSTPAEIKKAYRRLMNQHHPDKLASRGLPEHMMKLAKEKTQEIRAAYDLIREARGFK